MRENPEAKVVVTGCLADHQKDLSDELGGIRLVLNKDKEKLLSILFPEENLPEFAIDQF